MTCLRILSAFLVIASISSAQHQNQADIDGLRGPVRSVLTESFDGDGDLNGRLASELVLYDREGFRVEEFRYDLDGSVHSHTRYTRKKWQVFKVETTSVSPDENRTAVTQFNSEGLVAGTETYDGSGVLLDKTTTDFSRWGAGPSSSLNRRRLMGPHPFQKQSRALIHPLVLPHRPLRRTERKNRNGWFSAIQMECQQATRLVSLTALSTPVKESQTER